MPKTMKKLGLIQFFSWFAFFTMWSMSNPALTEHVYNSPMPIQSDFNLNTNNLSYYDANTKFQVAFKFDWILHGNVWAIFNVICININTLYIKKDNK